MPESLLPSLDLDAWRVTRDSLHGYSKILGQVRRVMTPRRRHWSHITLQVAADGLTTTPIPLAGGTVELRLDLPSERLWIVPDHGRRRSLALDGTPPRALCRQVLAELAELGAAPEVDPSAFAADTALIERNGDGKGWDSAAVERYHRAVAAIEPVFQEFKGRQRRETTPVQLFPHHFDLALSWFSGRLVPGQDPDVEDSADEQMTFGFSTGDEATPEPYFYATAYPEPEGFAGSPLPSGARWEEEAYRGALLPYAAIRSEPDARQRLLDFLVAAHRAGAERMTG